MSWGPWIEHDGAGCPPSIIGKWIDMEAQHGPIGPRAGQVERREGPADPTTVEWDWRFFGMVWGKTIIARIIRYRVRKPSALTLLERIAADPQPIPGEPVPA